MAKTFDSRTITSELREKLKRHQYTITAEPVGEVLSVADGVTRVRGLSQIGYQELVTFENGVSGVTLSLEENEIGIVVLGNYLSIKQGDQVKATGRLMDVPVGKNLIGRVIDPLGNPLDEKGAIKSSSRYPIEKIAPGVVMRKPVDTPLQTGIKAIDSMVPIGRGQRELIIGDRGTGKTALAIDTIINQKDGVICIYVAIGQKQVRIAQVIEQLTRNKAMEHSIIVVASASDPASLQYLAPYAGCAIGEYFMDQGHDVLVIYDDLSKHAWAYRQISLVLRRPSGREAYPGDIFYLHSRLLERACRLNERLGGGSLTALPIIETQAGDISAYIPTNVISITDGQIHLETDLFNAGIRPAINAGLSVSRVGGAAQVKAMKQVAGPLRLNLAQYRELAAFVQFASDLDPATRSRIERGARMMEILKQPQFTPYPIEDQVIVFFAASNGYIDDISIDKVQKFERALLDYMKLQERNMLEDIKKEKKLTEELTEKLKNSIDKFKEQFLTQN